MASLIKPKTFNFRDVFQGFCFGNEVTERLKGPQGSALANTQESSTGQYPLHYVFELRSKECDHTTSVPNVLSVLSLLVNLSRATVLVTPDQQGHLPIHHALPIRLAFPEGYKEMKEYCSIISLLLSKNPECASIPLPATGELPLHTACKCLQKDGSVLITEVVLELANAFPQAIVTTDKAGNLPIHYLCVYNGSAVDKMRVRKLFYDLHPDCFSCPNAHQRLPLHIVCDTEKHFFTAALRDLVTFLVDCHPQGVHHKDDQGNLPIHFAADSNPFVASLLLDRFPSFIDTSVGGRNLLHLACQHRQGILTKGILGILKARPEHASVPYPSSQVFPLHKACENGLTMVISELIEAFPEALRLMDDNGNLPIHLAVAKPNRESKQQTEILHSNYPQGFLQKNHKGQRPIDCCGKDDMLFAHLAHLCPESLLIVDAPEKRGPLAPLTAYLLRHYKFPSCRARFLQRVFDAVIPHSNTPHDSQQHAQEIIELKERIHKLETEVETSQNQCDGQSVEKQKLMELKNDKIPHLAAASPTKESQKHMEIFFSKYPQGFLQKNHKGQMPIDCCGKDDKLFAIMAQLCPESLYNDEADAPQKRGPLAPLTAHLLRHYKFPACRARFLQRVFDTVLPHIKSRESLNHGQEIKELKQQIHHLQTKVETIQNQCNRQNVEKQKLDQLQELRNKKDQQQQQQHVTTKTPVHYVDCLSSISHTDQEQFEEFTANGPSKRARVSIDGL